MTATPAPAVIAEPAARTVHVERCMGTVFTIDVRGPGDWTAAIGDVLAWCRTRTDDPGIMRSSGLTLVRNPATPRLPDRGSDPYSRNPPLYFHGALCAFTTSVTLMRFRGSADA
jgi:hypothetical protein